MNARAARVTARVRVLPGVLRAAARIALLEWMLRRSTLPEVAARFGAPLASASDETCALGTPPTLTEKERQMLRAYRWVLSRSPFGSTCLRRALCAGHVLRAREPRLAVGVAKRDGVVTAHAWLVVNGANLDPEGSADFVALSFTDRLPTLGDST